MPYFIDRHEECDLTTPELEAQRNLDDIKIQKQFNCRKISYWYDDKQNIAFCLFEAPDKGSIQALHNEAHPNIPNQIFEVDTSTINSFFNHIRCQPELKTFKLPESKPIFFACDLNSPHENIASSPFQTAPGKKYYKQVNEAINVFDGTILSQMRTFFLIAFSSVSMAIKCATKMHEHFYNNPPNSEKRHLLKIGINGGISNSSTNYNIKASTKLAQRLCYIAKNKILLTQDVKSLFTEHNTEPKLNEDKITIIQPDEVIFLTLLFNYMEMNWKNPNLHISDFEEQFHCSKSQIYRKMVHLSGQSPNAFIKTYRLHRASELLRLKKGNISEIAFSAGFNSSSYFTKCFLKEYGIKPSDYISELL